MREYHTDLYMTGILLTQKEERNFKSITIREKMYISIQNAAGDANIISYNTCTYKMGRDTLLIHTRQMLLNYMNIYKRCIIG